MQRLDSVQAIAVNKMRMFLRVKGRAFDHVEEKDVGDSGKHVTFFIFRLIGSSSECGSFECENLLRIECSIEGVSPQFCLTLY